MTGDAEVGGKDVRVFADVEELNYAAADEFVRLANEAVNAKGSFTVALAGGSTPKKLYALLASHDAPYRSQVPWSQIDFFFGDERCVLPDHADSNYRMAHDAMLADVPATRVHRFLTERGTAEEVAAEYETRLRSILGTPAGETPRLDLILLGLGTDGHTASLFPETTALTEHARAVVANRVATLDTVRLTLTFPVLNQAANIIFLVSGAEKSTPLRRVLESDEKQSPLPAQLVQPLEGALVWMVDRAAMKR
jgi:6-phosphogluconolactonase